MILLAERTSPWRDRIAEGLRADGQELEVTQNGSTALAALHRTPGVDIAVIGIELDEISGIDVVFLASSKGGCTARRVLFICPVRSDLELMELIRKRGVAGFLYPNEPEGTVVDRILAVRHSEARATVRVPCQIETSLRWRTQTRAAVIVNLSTGGAQIELSAKDAPDCPSADERFELSFFWGGATLSCKAEVRRITERKRIFGGRQLVLGVQFHEISPSRERLVEIVEGLMKDLASSPGGLLGQPPG